MAEVIEEAIKGLQATDAVVDEIAEVVKIPNVKLIAASTLVVGVAVGAGAGYFFAKRQLETKYSQIAEAEITEMREHFNARELARRSKPDLEDLAAPGKAEAIIENEGYREGVHDGVQATVEAIKHDAADPNTDPIIRDVPDYMKDPNYKTADDMGEPPVKSHYTGDSNVFEAAEPENLGSGWDYATELKRRNGLAQDLPYVIHYDELGEEDEMDCVTYTYYVGDDVLCDEMDRAVDDRDSVIGEGNLALFGHGSNDPDIVYIRNPKIKLEYEIVRNERTYQADVLGMSETDENELRHAKMPRRRRWDDA